MKHTSHTISIIGNWKMNPETKEEAISLTKSLVRVTQKYGNIVFSIAAPHIFLERVVGAAAGKIEIGTQNIYHEGRAAATGETSVSQIHKLGASFVIVGHSERRALGETETHIQKKIALALQEKIRVVLCVGETLRDGGGEYLSLVEKQIISACEMVPPARALLLSIAYEPVWAIGAQAQRVATVEECCEMSIFIRKVLSDIYGERVARKIHILYGGSASSKNVQNFLEHGKVDGFLLGRASLDTEEMRRICESL